jgi:hypothetical protein
VEQTRLAQSAGLEQGVQRAPLPPPPVVETQPVQSVEVGKQ